MSQESWRLRKWPRKGPRKGRWVCLGIFGMLIASCSTSISPKNLVPHTSPSLTRYPETVALEVTGGRATDDAAGRQQVSNEAYSEALANAIRSSGLFSAIQPSQSANYVLRVQIVAMEQPMFGASFTVTMVTGWQLVNVATGQPVGEKGVTSRSTVTMGDSFWGPERLTRATEGAARENIRLGLEWLSTLPLGS